VVILRLAKPIGAGPGQCVPYGLPSFIQRKRILIDIMLVM
jgi:hypothetical protein